MHTGSDLLRPMFQVGFGIGIVWVCLGCDQGPTPSTSPPAAASSTDSNGPRNAAPAPSFTAASSGESSSIETGDGRSTAEGVSAAAEVESSVEKDSAERVVAETGVGKRGRNYGGGVITEPVRQYFRAGERIAFIQLDKAMRDFKVLHERLPQDDAEFQQEIIEANAIRLPDLPEGERYVYDAQAGELMVERPQPSRQP